VEDVDLLKERLALVLSDFSRNPDETLGEQGHLTQPSRHDFPVPELALFVLRDLMEFKSYGPSEKLRWTVVCAFQGYPCTFELRKSGFTAFVGGDKRHLQLALGALRKAMKLADRVLQKHAHRQAALGNVALANRFADFDCRYRYFREQAAIAYASPDPPATPMGWNAKGEPTAWVSSFMKGAREGNWLASAMVDAFYSRLEHEMVLLLAFTSFDPGNGELVRIIRADWDDKFKAHFDITADRPAKALYDSLKALKDKVRNPQAHGGFEKGWQSLYFHVPRVGTLPGNLMEFSESNEFKLISIEVGDYDTICATFDRFDEFIKKRLFWFILWSHLCNERSQCSF
jgi:hypothetical protein